MAWNGTAVDGMAPNQSLAGDNHPNTPPFPSVVHQSGHDPNGLIHKKIRESDARVSADQNVGGGADEGADAPNV